MEHVVEARLETFSGLLAITDPRYDESILSHAREVLRFVDTSKAIVISWPYKFRPVQGYRGASCTVNRVASNDLIDVCWVEQGPAVHVLPSWHVERALAKLDSEDAETLMEHLLTLADLLAEDLRRKLDTRGMPIQKGRRRDLGQLQQVALEDQIAHLHRILRRSLDAQSAFELAFRT